MVSSLPFACRPTPTTRSMGRGQTAGPQLTPIFCRCKVSLLFSLRFVWRDYLANYGCSPIALAATLQRERLLFASIPPDVLDHLNTSRPGQIRDRAWLVMFYSVALSTVSSSTPSDELTKARLRSNLWLAFNDVRLLLEPSASGIQALIIMACYVNEYVTPQLCWSLISQACTMLLALGITHWHLDRTTRERRAMLFWRLNDLDKALALILGRPPTLHRECAAAVPLPTLDQLLPARPHGGAPALFNAHYSHQMHMLSRIKSDIWHCLYGQDSAKLHVIRENLDSWNREATEVLTLSLAHLCTSC